MIVTILLRLGSAAANFSRRPTIAAVLIQRLRQCFHELPLVWSDRLLATIYVQMALMIVKVLSAWLPVNFVVTFVLLCGF